MEPFNYNNFHLQIHNYIQLAAKDSLSEESLNKFSQLVKQMPKHLTSDERKQLLDLGKKFEHTSNTLFSKINRRIIGLFYPTISGNPKFKEIVDTVKWVQRVGKAAEAPELRRVPIKPRFFQDIGVVIPKEYPPASIDKISEFVQKVERQTITPTEITEFLSFLENERIPLTKLQIRELEKVFHKQKGPEELKKVIDLAKKLEVIFGKRLEERMEDLKSKSGQLWQCIDRVRNETGGFSYVFRSRDEFDNVTPNLEAKEKTIQAKLKYDEMFPAVEFPAAFSLFLDPSKEPVEMTKKIAEERLNFYGKNTQPETIAKEQEKLQTYFKVSKELNELGYVFSQERDGVPGSYLTLPDRETLMVRWAALRERKPELPPFDIHSSEGIAGHVPFVEAFFTHDVLLSTGPEFIHDQIVHVVSTLHFILGTTSSDLDVFIKNRELSFSKERFRLVQLVTSEYRDLQIAKEGIKSGKVDFGENTRLIEQMEALLGSIVDVLTNFSNALDTKGWAQGKSIWNLTLSQSNWLNYFKDESRSGIKAFDPEALRKFVPELKFYVQKELAKRKIFTSTTSQNQRNLALENPFQAISKINNDVDLELRKIGIKTVDDLLKFADVHGKQITSINLEFREMNDEQLKLILEKLPNLRRLDLTGCESLTSTGIATVLNKCQLRSLIIRGRTDAAGIIEGMAEAGKFLTALNLDDCPDSFNVDTLIRNFPNLEALSIINSGTNPASEEKLIRQLQHLTEIRCSMSPGAKYLSLKKEFPAKNITLG